MVPWKNKKKTIQTDQNGIRFAYKVGNSEPLFPNFSKRKDFLGDFEP